LAKEQRGKLDLTSIRGIFAGYTPTTRQYRVYDPKKRTVERYSTVRFDEKQKGGILINSYEGPKDLRIEGEEVEIKDLKLNDIGDTIII
jgi:hypothetical protein